MNLWRDVPKWTKSELNRTLKNKTTLSPSPLLSQLVVPLTNVTFRNLAFDEQAMCSKRSWPDIAWSRRINGYYLGLLSLETFVYERSVFMWISVWCTDETRTSLAFRPVSTKPACEKINIKGCLTNCQAPIGWCLTLTILCLTAMMKLRQRWSFYLQQFIYSCKQVYCFLALYVIRERDSS